MKNIAILGSTGSIGTQALDVIKRAPERYNVVGLTANQNTELLEQQVKEFKPEAVAIGDKGSGWNLNLDIPVYTGIEGLSRIATLDSADIVLTSVVGSVGLEPTLHAIEQGKTIALANKETLVTAGELVMETAAKHNVDIIPVDSEHSALFQCLQDKGTEDVRRLILTCSGGSFYGKKAKDLEHVTAKDALKHPNWDMGGKITIDSATLMNKGFEVIEAMWLYDMPLEKIDVVIHPESIIHSMVEYNDGSIIAQLATHDMRLPIQYALSYPERYDSDLPKLDFRKFNRLTFAEPDMETFPCLKYAYDAAKIGGTTPAVMNAANEVAVAAFLGGQCSYLDIPKAIKHAMYSQGCIHNPVIEEILEADMDTRRATANYLKLENKNK